MKGYIVLIVIVFTVISAVSPVMLQGVPPCIPVAEETVMDISVKHTASQQHSNIGIEELALYETMAQISWEAPVHAIQAQALACLTCVYYQQKSGQPYQSTSLTYPDAYSEAYWKEQLGESYGTAMTVYRQAFEQIKEKRIVYNGEPIMALTHPLNTGLTETSSVVVSEDLPYLQSVSSPADALSPTLKQEIAFTDLQIKQLLESHFGRTLTNETLNFKIVNKTQAGTVLDISVAGELLSGKTIQALFSLPSSSFEIRTEGDSVVFSVSGKGHFAGMSTYGAIAFANDGQTYDQIIRYYYKGVTIV